MALASGTRLGPYELLSQLGAGGMGEVYRARDARLGRDVAIKVLPAGVAHDADRRARFEREARAVAALSHPNILAIHDIGTQGELLYVVTEVLDGETLAERLTSGAVPVRKAIEIAVAIARGLSAAHSKGIAHRDLKPANVFLGADGHVKILDFGLAKETAPEASGATLTQAPLTDLGTIVGTAGYMAPEQVRGAEVDGRADLFALGTVLYEMLTGRRAFARDTTAETMTAVLRDDPPELVQTRSDLPPALDRIVRHCLEKSPVERFQTARDVIFALESLSGSAPTAAVQAVPNAPQRRLLGLVAVLALAVIGAPWWAGGLFRQATARRVQFTVALPANVQLPIWASPAVAPDGSAIAFIALNSKSESNVWIHTPADGRTRVVTGTDGVQRLSWSPDGQQVAFFTTESIKMFRAAGGQIETVSANLQFADDGASLTWAGNDTLVFSLNGTSGLRRVAATGGPVQSLTEPDRQHGETGHMWPYGISGNQVIFSVARKDSAEKTLVIQSLDGGTPRPVINVSSSATFDESASLFFNRGRSLVSQRFDPVRATLAGDRSLIADDLSVISARSFDAAGGTLAYLASERQTSLAWVDRAGRQISTVETAGAAMWPAVAPDDRRIAVDVENPDSGIREIWLIDGLRRSRLTFGPLHDSDAVWAPDGQRLAFAHNEGGEVHELTVGQGGSRRLHEFGAGTNFAYPTDWSRDGQWIAYASFATGIADIWLLPASGTAAPTPLTTSPFSEHQARFSPDGRYLAYAANDSGRPEVYIQAMPPAKGRWTVSTNGGAQPMWRGDGKELYYVTLDNMLTSVPIKLGSGVTVGIPSALFKIQGSESLFNSVRNHYSVTSDGHRFVVNSVAGRVKLNVILNWAGAGVPTAPTTR